MHNVEVWGKWVGKGQGVRGKEEGGEVFRERDGPTFPRMWEKCWRGSIASGGGTPTAGSE